MIKRDEQQGAYVAYLDDDFQPVDKSRATRVKVIYDNGRVVHGKPDPATIRKPTRLVR